MLRPDIPLEEFKLERYFARWEFTAPHVLCASDCETMTIGQLLALAQLAPSALLDLPLGYTDSQGAAPLRETIATFYPGLSADDILVTNAPQEAIFLAMTTLLMPGDRVIVQTPCYQSLAEVARHRGCEVVDWPMVETESGFRTDLDLLRKLLVPDTKLLVVNAPHNPTGYLPSRQDQQALDRPQGWLN